MADWWFGWVHHAEQYKLWHPRDQIFSDWEGPRDNNSTYNGGHHLVHEYIGDNELAKLKISFREPGEYFELPWRDDFQGPGYQTAVCGRCGNWNPETGEVLYSAHLIHLVRNEFAGCRMRSRFRLRDVEGIEDPEAADSYGTAFCRGWIGSTCFRGNGYLGVEATSSLSATRSKTDFQSRNPGISFPYGLVSIYGYRSSAESQTS